MTRDDEHAGELQAYTETPADTVIELRAYETEHGYVERVEVVDGPERITLFEGHGLTPTQVYNQTIEPYVATVDGGRVEVDR